mmetsp:Transcript_53790/g.156852  ORF Transcript_53790/g.156852 Transcript_53790/m.156852 type:complete len:408 (-) Transcript_53790:28-1251(-)
MPHGEHSAGGSGFPIVVLDSGGGYVRAGLAISTSPSATEPNCTAVAKGQAGRPPVVGVEALELPACTLHRPTRRGLLVDPEQQRFIWDAILHKRLSLDTRECVVVATEAPLTPPSVRRDMEDVLFETFGFREVCILPAPPLALHSPGLRRQLDPKNPCCTVLSLGFSGCIATPCVDGQPINSAVRRLNVGGRVLTNILLERLCLRHYDLNESWLVAEDILSKLCEVSPDFDADLRTRFRRVERRTYVLPDFKIHKRGFVEEAPADPAAPGTADAQHVTLGAERVVVPEALFSPRDHGIPQAGVAELVQQAILAAERPPWQAHLGQVALCGGLARLPGLGRRLQRELRELLPAAWQVRVISEEEPELSVWRGAAQVMLSPELRPRGGLKRAWEEESRQRRTSQRVSED